MDISSSTAPRSDQQNYDDYIAGPKTVTISEVRQGSAEQPVEIHLSEFPGRPYKPSKSMRRVLVAAWGAEASAYVGRRIRLYGDPDVTFGRDKVGGIKIAALSHIDKPLSLALTVTRGKRAPFTVQPLEEVVDPVVVEKALTAITNATSTQQLDSIAEHATRIGISAAITNALNTRRNELQETT